MKQSLLFVGGLLTGTFSLFAQQTPVSQTPQNRNAVLEELTGIHCGYCPDGHKRANDIAAANPGRVVLVNVHAGGYATPGAGEPDFRTTAGTALDGFFNPTGYPAGSVQRYPDASDMARIATGRGNWANQVSTVLAEASEANVAMDATIDATTREVTVHVEIFYTTPQASGTNHYLNVGFVQNNVEEPQSNYGSPTPYNPSAVLPNGNYMHQHIFRGYVNTSGTWGDAIDASQTTVITQTYTYTLPASIGNVHLNINELQFFAILHEGHNAVTTSKVITAAEVTPTMTNIPAGTANASSITNLLTTCNGGTVTPIVKVINDGDAITSIDFSTSVNGGTPVTYTFNGNIPAFGEQEITLPAVVVNAQQSNNCVVTITAVNGGSGNVGSVASATKAVVVAANTANDLNGTVKTNTDAYGSETSWKLYNSSGSVVAQGGPYADQSAAGSYPQADVNFAITANECYKLVVSDLFGDGFDSGYGNGSVQVYSGTTVVAGVTTFSSGKEKQDAFMSNAALSVNEASEAISMSVYPNPAFDNVNVSFEGKGGDYSVVVTDLSGRTISTESVANATGATVVTINTSSFQAGNYFVTVSNGTNTFTQKVIVK